MNNKKKFGIVYTPSWMVEMMLNKLPSYKNVVICDPACGDGQFLVAIVKRVCSAIRHCRCEESRNKYFFTLENLTGLDIDKSALNLCQERLDALVQKYNYNKINWNLHEIDVIDKNKWLHIAGHIDVVVGNPPYIRIQHLEKQRRQRIGNNWQLTSGNTDIFYLFFEMGLELLRSGGRLVYITPNSWLKSKSGSNLRECLRNSHQILSITDFREHQVFEEATTYTAITEIKKDGTNQYSINGWKCSSINNGTPKLVKGKIDLTQKTWNVFTLSDNQFIDQLQKYQTKLGDVAEINVGIQTLADDVFIFKTGNLDIEEEITRCVVKATKMINGSNTIKQSIIYPYDSNGQLIPEKLLNSMFPKAYTYLVSQKSRLLARDKGKIKQHKWYSYGRSVSILSGFGEKILTSSMNRTPNFQKCADPNYLYYSGYAIKPNKGVSMSALLSELNGNEMKRFIQLVSRPFRGGWFSYAKSIIETFPVSDKVYE